MGDARQSRKSTKTSSRRSESMAKIDAQQIARAVLCGLAVTCLVVMYISADGAQESVLEIVRGKDAGTSVDSTDVLKAGQIYTETPNGRMRLMDYFNGVERRIASELSNRRADVASVRAQMARDFAFNAAARSKLKRNMLHKMAVNAKTCRDNLNTAMRRTQEKFAKKARLANRRWWATMKRDKKTIGMINRDSREAARNLRLSVSTWQRATSAWAAATNSRINKMNRHVAANSAQIKENAKKAQKDLEKTMRHWDYKVNSFKRSSKHAQSKLRAQFRAQDKAQRAWANNRISALVASTAASFHRVNVAMAKQRHEIDMAMKHATTRFAASLNAARALEDRRYARSIADIQAARKETSRRVAAAKKEFKVGILRLSSVVKQQVQKVTSRIDATAGVVRSNRAAQAKINANVNAETSRMVRLGNKRYKAHLKNDRELKRLIHKDQATTSRRLNKIASTFNSQLSQVRRQLKRDRKHSERALSRATGRLYRTLARQQAAQLKKNAAMEAATRRMRLDMMDRMRRTKTAFRRKVLLLGKVVAKNDKKANIAITKLTGVVRRNEARSRSGRKLIASLEEANKAELKSSLRTAIQKGEKRAAAVLKSGRAMNKRTKAARAELKKEMTYAIRSAASVAKKDLRLAIAASKRKMLAFMRRSAASKARSALARKALLVKLARNKRAVARMISGAVATQTRAQLALRAETAKKIKKTNMRVTAYAARMARDAKRTAAKLKATSTSILNKIAAEQKRAQAALRSSQYRDRVLYARTLKTLRRDVALAEKHSNDKFNKVYQRLASNRARADSMLAANTNSLNDALAKQAALADARFAKTVKDLRAARAQAKSQVNQLRKSFTSGLNMVTSHIKDVETRLTSEISVVSAEVVSVKANQMRVNRRVAAEIKRIRKIANKRHSAARRARGKLKMLMDENKAAAAQEVKALSRDTVRRIGHLRARAARNRIAMARDLTRATKKLYKHMSKMQHRNLAASRRLNRSISASKVATRNALKHAKRMFASKVVMLSNTVAANLKRNKADIARVTGVVMNIAKANAADRRLIRQQTKALEADMNKSITRSIQLGEAQAKATAQRIAEYQKGAVKRFLRVELTERLENAADNVFKTISGKRNKIADNSLSLKAYAIAAKDKVIDYRGKKKGSLSSIGDLLATPGALDSVRIRSAPGLGLGGNMSPPLFSGKKIKQPKSLSKINGLVNEFTRSVGQVRMRWPLGLGKYLMDKLEEAMMSRGVLEVDKISGKRGNFVYINGRSVGLSNKLNDFSKLAAPMGVYESTLAKLTAQLTKSSKGKKPAGKIVVKPPEWQGK